MKDDEERRKRSEQARKERAAVSMIMNTLTKWLFDVAFFKIIQLIIVKHVRVLISFVFVVIMC